MSREFYVPCQPYAYPIRSRLSSSGGRIKSLLQWRNGRWLRDSKGSPITRTSSREEVSVSDDCAVIVEAAGNNPSDETNASRIESQENKSSVPPHNRIDSNLVSSSFDPTMSSYFTDDSMPSLNTDDNANEESETTPRNFSEASNLMTESSDSSNFTLENSDEINPISAAGSLLLPSAVIGIQIQSANPDGQMFDFVPILYVENSPSNTRRTNDTEETFAAHSGSEDSSSNENDSTESNSTGTLFEIVAMMEENGRRFENDFARTYYDANARKRCGSGASEGVVSVNGVVGGMDCMPLRPGPFHYLISEQAKSLVALQELQNEVGALLEFRDLVIETFPNLRHKMAVTAAASAAAAAANSSSSVAGNGTASVLMSSSQGSHIPLPLSSQSPSSRRIGEWEPGKVRRRVAQSRENESSSSSLPRSRSNSHSGGNKHSATVQDSGFSTETSSKDSASTAIPRPQSPSGRPVLDEAEDELWNLLDVIHRKGVRLREEVESLQGRLESVAPEELDVPSDILDAVRKVTRRHHSAEHLGDGALDSRDEDLLLDETATSPSSQVALLQREKLQLLDKVAELEAETISSRARAQELQSELAALSALKSDLEDRLRAGLGAADAGILAPGAHRLQPIEPTAPTSSPHALQSPRSNGAALNIRSKDSAFASVAAAGINAGKTSQKSRFRTRTIEKSALANVVAASRSIEDVHAATSGVSERRAKLGALDSVLISPTRVPGQVRRGDVDSRKIAAILREKSPLELQRHLITTTVHNQVLQKRLNEVEKSTETLSERLGKAHEENEDLRFQLAERNIELEGTRARVRVLERLQQRPATENDADDESEPQHTHNGHQQAEPASSSTDSSRETQQTNNSNSTETQNPLKPSPRRRPSRIPLLGATKATAPKPPNSATTPTGTIGHRRNDSKDSLKSLTAQKSSNNPSISSNRLATVKTGRDSSRESLNKNSLSKSQNLANGNAREPASRSLPRNNGNRDSLNKQPIGGSSLSRNRDSLESNSCNNNQAPGTPPRRPPAPARRSQSQASRPTSANVGDSGADTGKSMQSSNPPSSWLSSGVSLYSDSLNSNTNVNDEDEDETSSRTGSTRVEFIIGSPTRKRFHPPWGIPRYFDSIDTEGVMMEESLVSDEYPPRMGEALAECDSLECAERLDSDC